ncbi:MAG: outer membrane protein assembly factor BamD, partial [Deltaproteobacteria bacterium]
MRLRSLVEGKEQIPKAVWERDLPLRGTMMVRGRSTVWRRAGGLLLLLGAVGCVFQPRRELSPPSETAEGEITPEMVAYLHGLSLMAQSNYPAAARHFHEMATRFPESPWVSGYLFLEGESYFRGEIFPLAREAFRRYLETFPNGKRREEATLKLAICIEEAGESGGETEPSPPEGAAESSPGVRPVLSLPMGTEKRRETPPPQRQAPAKGKLPSPPDGTALPPLEANGKIGGKEGNEAKESLPPDPGTGHDPLYLSWSLLSALLLQGERGETASPPFPFRPPTEGEREALHRFFAQLREEGIDAIVLPAYHRKGRDTPPLDLTTGVFFPTQWAPVLSDAIGEVAAIAGEAGIAFWASMTLRFADFSPAPTGKPHTYRCEEATGRLLAAEGLDLFDAGVEADLGGLLADLAQEPIDGILLSDLFPRYDEGCGPRTWQAFIADHRFPAQPRHLFTRFVRRGLNRYRIHDLSPLFWQWARWKRNRMLDLAERSIARIHSVDPDLPVAIPLDDETLAILVYREEDDWVEELEDFKGFDHYFYPLNPGFFEEAWGLTGG